MQNFKKHLIFLQKYGMILPMCALHLRCTVMRIWVVRCNALHECPKRLKEDLKNGINQGFYK